MGTKDNVSSEYMKQNRIFADVFNYIFYQGEERILSENLFEKDTVQVFNSLDKKDKIKPVCTVVIYFGPKEWDAPRSLYEMFDLDDELKKFIPDYKINLIIPSEIEDFSKFDTELGKVLQFLKCSEDKDSLKELMRNDSSYECLDGDAAKMLGAFTNVKIKVEGGVCNMCKAVEDMIKEETEKVEKRVEKETAERVEKETAVDIARELLELNVSDDKILKATKISAKQLEEIKNKA